MSKQHTYFLYLVGLEGEIRELKRMGSIRWFLDEEHVFLIFKKKNANFAFMKDFCRN